MSVIILILKIFAIIALIIIALLLLILFIPFKYQIIAEITGKIYCKLNIAWMFGLIKIQALKVEDKPVVKIYLYKVCLLTKKIGDNSKEEANKKVKNRSFVKELDLETVKGILIYVKQIINIIKPESVSIEGCYGSSDPYITGIISVISCFAVNSGMAHNINLKPVFDGEALDIKAEILGGIFVIRAVSATLKLFLKQNIRKLAFYNSIFL